MAVLQVGRRTSRMSDPGVSQSMLEHDRAASLNRLNGLNRLNRLDRVAHAMDSLVRIPGTRRTFGVDAVLSIIPGLGSVLGAAVSGYLLYEAVRLRAPRALLMRMSRNIAVDWLLGEIPLLGPVCDLFYKANEANMKLLRAHLTAGGV